MIVEKEIRTHRQEELIEITQLIAEEVRESKIEEGQILVFIPHTTAGVTINENADPDVKKDILKGLVSLDFENIPFRHAEGNSPSHLKALLTGSSVQIIIRNSQMLLGTWQGIYFCEYDGPRTRKVLIQLFSIK